MDYTYTGAASADQRYLASAIAASAMIDKSLACCHAEGADLRAVFSGTLSAGDKAILDGIVVDAQTLPIGEKMARKIAALGAEITAFIEARYPHPTQASLNIYLSEAIDKGWVNRKVEIQKTIDWLTECLDEFYAKKAAVLAATTVAAVQAVTLDLTGVAVSDPQVSLETVKGMVS